jgi:hypothetical protein
MRKNDLIERFRKCVDARIRRDEWAQRAIDLLAKGKDEAGMDAAAKAKYWDRKRKALLP